MQVNVSILVYENVLTCTDASSLTNSEHEESKQKNRRSIEVYSLDAQNPYSLFFM